MNLIRNHPAIALTVVLVLLAVSLSRLAGGNNAPTQQAYFFDVQSGTLFAGDVAALPPIAAPSGAEGVRAHVYSCGDCADADQRVIAYLETYSEQGKAWLRDRPLDEFATNPGHHVSAYSEGKPLQWVDAASGAGNQITARMNMACPGSRQLCSP